MLHLRTKTLALGIKSPLGTTLLQPTRIPAHFSLCHQMDLWRSSQSSRDIPLALQQTHQLPTGQALWKHQMHFHQWYQIKQGYEDAVSPLPPGGDSFFEVEDIDTPGACYGGSKSKSSFWTPDDRGDSGFKTPQSIPNVKSRTPLGKQRDSNTSFGASTQGGGKTNQPDFSLSQG